MKRLEDLTEPELSQLMSAMARAMEGVAVDQGVEKPLFVLLLFNDTKIGQYISNCSRQNMIAALRETAERFERKQDVARFNPYRP